MGQEVESNSIWRGRGGEGLWAPSRLCPSRFYLDLGKRMEQDRGDRHQAGRKSRETL